jgi:hypothetical protein
MRRKEHLIFIAILLLLGLTPLLWFHHASDLILGHDSGLTLFPISHFLDRLYIWTDRYGFGLDQSFALPGFMIHGLEALVSSFGFNIQTVQKIIFIFWLVLPGLAMYLFASSLEKEYKLKYVALPASILYMFNFFILQGWFIAERTKFSLYAAFPIVVYLLFRWQKKKLSTLLTSILISFTFFFLNGEGGLPLFGGIFVFAAAFILYYLVKNFSLRSIFDLVILGIETVVFSVLLNIYWIIPYGNFLKHSFSSQVTLFGGLEGVLGWVDYVSKDSSLSNLLRLQGVPEWYQNSLHPYAGAFFTNPFLILLSYVFPITAFIPLLVVKEKRLRSMVLFFSFLALFSMIFIAGSHPPFGAIYILMIKFIPGFLAFRTPFYKFAPALWFAYAILIGITVNYFVQKIEIKINKPVSFVFLAGVSIFLLAYHFPFFTGVFFDYMVGQQTTRVHLPAYVSAYAKWSEANDSTNAKTLVIPPSDPDNKLDIFSWGYFSNAPLTTVISNAAIVNQNFYMPAEDQQLIEGLYTKMKQNDPSWKNLANLLGIKSFLLRDDYVWNNPKYLTDSPKLYSKALSDPDVKEVKTFGKWHVFRLDTESQNLAPSLSYFRGNTSDIPLLTSLPDHTSNEQFYVADTTADNQQALLDQANKIYIKPECVECNLQRPYVALAEHTPLLTHDSYFHFLVSLQKRSLLKKLKTPLDHLQFYTYDTLSNSVAIQKTIDEDKSADAIIQSFMDYSSELPLLEQSLNTYMDQTAIPDSTFLETLDNVLRTERDILIESSDKISTDNLTAPLRDSFFALETLRTNLSKRFWMTSDETHKRFSVFVEKPGTYSMLYRPNDAQIAIKNIQYTIDGQLSEIIPQPVAPNLYSFPAVNLTIGEHRLEIEQPVANLYNGPVNPQIAAQMTGTCFFSNRISGMKNDVFRISLQHRRISGDKNFVIGIFSEKNLKSYIDVQGDVLQSNAQWENYQKDTILSKDNGYFYVGVCSRPMSDLTQNPPDIELQKIAIQKIAVPDIILSTTQAATVFTAATLEKKDQVTYTGTLQPSSNPAFIPLKETFEPDWELTPMQGNHFMLNGFANAWIVTNPHNQTFTVTYKTQRLVKYGFIVSAIIFAILCIVLCFLLFRKYAKKH